ncbi:MAG: metallophosphoesterase [Clostridia bacterium]|nr:metallophosphoesterase [Clostridia bacterium]
MSGFSFLAFFAVVLSIIGGANLYIARRVYQCLSYFFPNVRFGAVICVFAVFMLLMLLGFGSSMLPFGATAKRALNTVGMYCMGAFVYLLVFTVASDIVALAFYIFKQSVATASLFRCIAGIAVLALTASTVIYGIWNARDIDKISYTIKTEGRAEIPETKIALISDLHLGAIGSEARLERIVSEINAQNPDVICIAGDFFDTDFDSIRDPERAMETIKKLSAKYGVYMCFGNHDAGSTFNKMREFAEKCNINVLNDEQAVIDGRLVIVGRLDRSPIGGYGGLKRGDFSDFGIENEANLPIVVLDHNPAHIDSYIGSEADVVLCGHTHKGQLFPANLITNAMYKVDHGHYKENAESPDVIVTSGIGTWGMPMRVGTHSELVTIFVS